MESAIGWLVDADKNRMLATLEKALGERFETTAKLVEYLLGRKTYFPTLEFDCKRLAPAPYLGAE
jgi:hypothetical protein